LFRRKQVDPRAKPDQLLLEIFAWGSSFLQHFMFLRFDNPAGPEHRRLAGPPVLVSGLPTRFMPV
jgi:hypothetical protein